MDLTIPPPPLPAALPSLGIFPLPHVQLFPHTLMPLHVFEPRYRALTRACLAGSCLMGIAALAPGSEAHAEGRPPVEPVFGVGEIVQSRELPDGRFHILLRGVGRARLVCELPPSQPYRLVSAVRLDDVVAPGGGIAASHKALVALCEKLAAALPEGGHALRQLVRQEVDPGPAADVIAAALLFEPAARQALLVELEVAARLDHVNAAVAELVRRYQPATPAN